MEVSLLSMDDVPHGRSTPYERIRDANRSYLGAYRRNAGIMKVIEEVSRYDEQVRTVRDRRHDEFAARLQASIRRLQDGGAADPEVEGAYAALALGGMVAAFASALFVSGRPYDFDEAVEQLTILWANALGIARPSGARQARVG
jgi:hypothetical protein